MARFPRGGVDLFQEIQNSNCASPRGPKALKADSCVEHARGLSKLQQGKRRHWAWPSKLTSATVLKLTEVFREAIRNDELVAFSGGFLDESCMVVTTKYEGP